MKYFIADRDCFFITIDDIIMGLAPREMNKVVEKYWDELKMTVGEAIFLYFTTWL